MPAPRIPAYRKHKGRRHGHGRRNADRAVVTLNGRQFALGRYGSPESRLLYNQLIQEWLAAGRQTLRAQDEPTVAEIAVAFLAHAERRYRHPDDGRPTSEVDAF